MRILVFDTETTGLPKTKIINPDTLNEWPTIVQFSYLIYDTTRNDIIETSDDIINVPNNIIITDESTKIHGITNKISSEKGVDIEFVLFKFFEILNSVDEIIGHNINFDINMIKVELLRILYKDIIDTFSSKMYKENLFKITNFKNTYCTLQNSIKLCNIKAFDKKGKSYLKFPKLIELHETLFNSSPENLHNSFNDILVTLRCFIKMKYDIDLLETCENFKNISNRLVLF